MKKQEIRQSSAAIGGLVGTLVGSLAGPWGIPTGPVLGAQLGYDLDPEEHELGWLDVVAVAGIVWLVHLAIAGQQTEGIRSLTDWKTTFVTDMSKFPGARL